MDFTESMEFTIFSALSGLMLLEIRFAKYSPAQEASIAALPPVPIPSVRMIVWFPEDEVIILKESPHISDSLLEI